MKNICRVAATALVHFLPDSLQALACIRRGAEDEIDRQKTNPIGPAKAQELKWAGKSQYLRGTGGFRSKSYREKIDHQEFGLLLKLDKQLSMISAEAKPG